MGKVISIFTRRRLAVERFAVFFSQCPNQPLLVWSQLAELGSCSRPEEWVGPEAGQPAAALLQPLILMKAKFAPIPMFDKKARGQLLRDLMARKSVKGGASASKTQSPSSAPSSLSPKQPKQ
jgi:hypothetical protein